MCGNLFADLGSCALELFQASFQPLHVTNQLTMFLAKKVLIQVDLHMVMQKYNDHPAHKLASAVLDSKLAC